MKLQTNSEKKIEFNITLKDIDYTALSGKLTLMSNKAEYSFPVNINSKNIIAIIPPLEDVAQNIPTSMGIKLELMAEELYVIPWRDTVQIKNVPKILAAAKEIDKKVSKIVIEKVVEPIKKTYFDKTLNMEIEVEEV